MKSGSQLSRLPLTIAAAAVFAAFGSAGAMAQQSSTNTQPNQAQASQTQSSQGQTGETQANASQGQSQGQSQANDSQANESQSSQSQLQANASQSGQSQLQANASQSGQASASGQSTGNNKELQQIKKQNPDLSTFIDALHKTGLESALNQGGQYTLFAPTDQAFKSMSNMSVDQLMQPQNREQLIKLLRSHIVADNVTPKMARELNKAETLNGNNVDLSAKNGQIMVGNAKVVGKSIQQGNIRVYPIDQVQFMGAGQQSASNASGQQHNGQTQASNPQGNQSGQTGQEQASNLPNHGNQSQQ